MRKSRFTGPQIMALLRQPGSGVAVPELCRELAEQAVATKGGGIALACRTFGVSATCFRYSPRRDAENAFIAALLEGLTKAHRTGALDYVSCTCATSGGTLRTISMSIRFVASRS